MVRTEFAYPSPTEYADYYDTYISRFKPDDFLVAFEAQVAEMRNLFGNLSEDQVSCLHEPYTWTLKQLMGHLIDCERIFSTRLLRIAAGDDTPVHVGEAGRP